MGLGTVINVVTVIVGALVGMAVGHRFPERTRGTVTDCLGLVTLLMAGLSVVSVTTPALGAAVGSGVPVLIVLGSLLVGSISGSLLRVESRLESLAGRVQAGVSRRFPSEGGHDARERFIEGWLSATLLFCVGPLTILGSLSDGLGVVASTNSPSRPSSTDSRRWPSPPPSASECCCPRCRSPSSRGSITLVGVLLGSVMPEPHIAAHRHRWPAPCRHRSAVAPDQDVPVGDMLPALVVAPLLTHLVIALR